MDRLHITLEPRQKIFVTSDLHFGHRNILKFCNRPFSDIKEMSEKLISNWNEVVGKNDIVEMFCGLKDVTMLKEC